MATTRQCAECGTPLPDDVPQGACPVCALRGALELPDVPSQAAVTEKPGDRIGRYKLLEKIGEGGYGTVYMAEQAEPIRRRVALKVVKLGMDTKQVIARFEAERQALALMDHPNIAKVLDAGATDTGRPYFVMELVRGIKITDYCNEHRLSTRERLVLFMQVCHAVQHAHQKGIIHRDIKPSNILVTQQDGKPVPKVIDFGIAKATQQPLTDKTLFTSFQQFMGTPAYMSPEQAEMGPQDIDTRSDVYTLGVLLYELLTGRLPFERKELLEAGLDEMRRLIREKEPPKPSTRLSTLAHGDLTAIARSRQTEPPRLLHLVRGDLDWIVMKCLEKDRARRYETANELARDVGRHLNNEPVTAAAPSALYRTGKFVRRHRVALATATVLALPLAAGVVALAVARGFRIERDAARQITALRSAELAARSGQWRQALKQWYQAEAAGYNDQVYLGLQRAEAWTVLSEPARAKAELRRLAKRSDLGKQTGAVLLRLGEHELFDQATAQQGVQHVREALALGLAGADDPFARGLLAESTPEALDLMQQALRINSFHHGAHRHSLGMEFLLGRTQELEIHMRVFRMLYPDDPSPKSIEAIQLALQGDVAAARARLAALGRDAAPETLARLDGACQSAARLAEYCASDAFVAGPMNQVLSGLQLFQGPSVFAGMTPLASERALQGGRIPQLPCVQKGLLEAGEGLKALTVPFLGNAQAAIEKVKSGWRHHPEASLPVWAALLLENRHPPEGPKSPVVLQAQAALLQLGADSPSIIPKLPRMARYLAAQIEYELARGDTTNAASFRTNCQANIRRAALEQDATPVQCRAWYELAVGLEDYDSAHTFLSLWRRLEPANPQVQKLRHQLRSLEAAADAREGGDTAP